MYAKKNYEKYLSALKNSGLVSVEEKTLGAAEVTDGADGGAGAVVLMGKTISPVFKTKVINIVACFMQLWRHFSQIFLFFGFFLFAIFNDSKVLFVTK